MSRELDKVMQSMMTATERDIAHSPAPSGKANSFVTFRYSLTEISSRGGNLQVKMKETRFQDGRLVSEECEGTLDRGAYDAVVRDAQQQFLTQLGNLMKLFFFPFSGKDRY